MSKHTLIYIDDHDFDQRYITRLVDSSKCEIRCFDELPSGKEINLIKPDLILLDLNLRETSGEDTVRHAFKQKYKAPIAIVSACNNPFLVSLLKKQGIVEYFVKPILNRDEFNLKIESIIRNRPVYEEQYMRRFHQIPQNVWTQLQSYI